MEVRGFLKVLWSVFYGVYLYVGFLVDQRQLLALRHYSQHIIEGSTTGPREDYVISPTPPKP